MPLQKKSSGIRTNTDRPSSCSSDFLGLLERELQSERNADSARAAKKTGDLEHEAEG